MRPAFATERASATTSLLRAELTNEIVAEQTRAAGDEDFHRVVPFA